MCVGGGGGGMSPLSFYIEGKVLKVPEPLALPPLNEY